MSSSGALARMLSWRRVLSAVTGCVLVSFFVLPAGWTGSYALLMGRLLLSGLMVLLAFGLLERWPARLPGWLPRWALVAVGVPIAVPVAVAITYTLMTLGERRPWFRSY